MATTITRHAVTWTLNGTVTNGTFLGGDPYVVAASVSLTSRTPAPTGSGINTRNGGMVNPTAYLTQGFDGRIDTTAGSSGMDASYGPGYVVALNAENSLPLTINAGETLCSAVSGNLGQTTYFANYEGNPSLLSDMSYLTVLASAPASPSTTFRPAYAGSTKTLWTTADVDYGLLPGLVAGIDPVQSQSAYTDFRLDAAGDMFNRSQWDLIAGSQPAKCTMFPRNNMLNGYDSSSYWYPSDRALKTARLAILACSSHARATDAANRLIQLGIDLFGCLQAAGNNSLFANGAGFWPGYYFPILFAGKMLGYQPMLDVLTATYTSTGPYDSTNTEVDMLGKSRGAFGETGSFYYTTTAWASLDLPRPLGSYSVTGVPLYGDPRYTAGVTGNDTRRDPAMAVDAQGDGTVQYASWPLTTAAGWGDYMHNVAPPFAGQIAAAILLGWSSSYPAAALDWFYRWEYDTKLLNPSYTIRDRDVFGGTANDFMRTMWDTYRPAAPTYPSVTVSNPTLRVTV
jgi:hypothetical protein